MKRPLIRFMLLLASSPLIILNPLNALESDKSKQVIWSSDGGSTMTIMGDFRVLEMDRNVVVTQGSLEILGDRAIFEYIASTNELRKVTVHGEPVNYQQQLNENGQIVSGSSKTLIFYTNDLDETVLELQGSANIESPDSTVSCNSIIYIVDQDLIREAVGPCQGALSSKAD